MAQLNANALNKPSDIQELYETELGTEVVVSCINMAYLRTQPLSGKLGECGGDDALKEIERLLAIHFLTLREPETKRETVGDAVSVTFRGDGGGRGLESSRWGQTAIEMDCSGKLASVGLKRVDVDVISQNDF